MVYSKHSHGTRIQFNFIYIESGAVLFQILTPKQASKKVGKLPLRRIMTALWCWMHFVHLSIKYNYSDILFMANQQRNVAVFVANVSWTSHCSVCFHPAWSQSFDIRAWINNWSGGFLHPVCFTISELRLMVVFAGAAAAWDQKQEVHVTDTGMAPKRENIVTTIMKRQLNPFVY